MQDIKNTKEVFRQNGEWAEGKSIMTSWYTSLNDG